MSSLETEVSPGRAKLLCEKLDFKLVGCDGHEFANHSIAFMGLTHAAKRQGEWDAACKLKETEKQTNTCIET